MSRLGIASTLASWLSVFCIWICLADPAHAQDKIKIRGVVMDSTGTPLAAAFVFIEGQDEVEETNDRGEFRLKNVRPQMDRVWVQRVGYLPRMVAFPPSPAPGDEIDIGVVHLVPTVLRAQVDYGLWWELDSWRRAPGERNVWMEIIACYVIQPNGRVTDVEIVSSTSDDRQRLGRWRRWFGSQQFKPTANNPRREPILTVSTMSPHTTEIRPDTLHTYKYDTSCVGGG